MPSLSQIFVRFLPRDLQRCEHRLRHEPAAGRGYGALYRGRDGNAGRSHDEKAVGDGSAVDDRLPPAADPRHAVGGCRGEVHPHTEDFDVEGDRGVIHRLRLGRARFFLAMTILIGYSLNARTINAIPQSPLVTAPFTKGSLFLFG